MSRPGEAAPLASHPAPLHGRTTIPAPAGQFEPPCRCCLAQKPRGPE